MICRERAAFPGHLIVARPFEGAYLLPWAMVLNVRAAWLAAPRSASCLGTSPAPFFEGHKANGAVHHAFFRGRELWAMYALPRRLAEGGATDGARPLGS